MWVLGGAAPSAGMTNVQGPGGRAAGALRRFEFCPASLGAGGSLTFQNRSKVQVGTGAV